MVSKKQLFGLTLMLLFFSSVSGQNEEEQRKYRLSNTDSITQLISSGKPIVGLSFHHHTTVIYKDIYLDTPEFDLYKNGLSLRFRKRLLGDGEITYAMQLKNEMTEDTSIRMEADEPELDFYSVKDGDKWVSLTTVLDVLFTQIGDGRMIEQSTNNLHAVALINQWIQFKADGIVKPFQKIAHLQLPSLTLEKVKTITPVLYGWDKRARISVYIDPHIKSDLSKLVPQSTAIILDKPSLFNENPEFIYALECSLDSATFYPLFDAYQTEFEILEFEVENKYEPSAIGTTVMSVLATELKKALGLNVQLDSKYRQSIQFLKSE